MKEEKHCGYCRRWRPLEGFTTVTRNRAKVAICGTCGKDRAKPIPVAVRDAFGKQTTNQLREEQATQTRAYNDMKKRQSAK